MLRKEPFAFYYRTVVLKLLLAVDPFSSLTTTVSSKLSTDGAKNVLKNDIRF